MQFNDVTKRFGDGPLILDKVRFSVNPGEFVSVIGPSGCGKSTLLRLVAGLSPVSEGSLVVDGMPPERAAAELAFVFQDPTLLPWLTVAANVELPLKLRGVATDKRAEARERSLRLVGLGTRARSHPRQLSGGQRMRVSIARALTLAPRLLLLDEPFGSLDEMNRERLNEELLAIRGTHGWAALFVTHSVAEAVFLSDRILILGGHPGTIVEEVPVPLPGPRSADTRLSDAYHAIVTDVSRKLRSAVSVA